MNLREAIGERELHHYTKYVFLQNILKAGALRLNKYVGTPKGHGQLATVRPSMITKENLENLSSASDGGVKFIIDASKASDAVRGLKISPLAELPVMHREEIEKMVGPRNSKKINLIMKELVSLMKKYPKLGSYTATYDTKENTKEIFGEEAYDAVVKHMEKWNYSMTRPNHVMNVAKRYRKYTDSREGEERLTLKNKGQHEQSLPLNKKYIKIELTKPDDMNDRLYKEKLVREMKKNKDLFVQNDIFKDMIKEETK